MNINDYKVISKEGYSIEELPNRPLDAGYTPQMLKQRFDQLSFAMVGLQKHNGLIDFLLSSGGANVLGIDVDGIEGATVGEVLNCIKGKLDLLLSDTQEHRTEINQLGELISGLDEIANDYLKHKTGSDHDTRYDERYVKQDTLGIPGGVAQLDSNGELPLSAIPNVVKITHKSVKNITQMLSLTKSDVQNGDFISLDEDLVWFQVIDDTKLGTMAAFKQVPTGVIGQAIQAQQFDPTYEGPNSIYSKISENSTKINGQETRVQTLEEKMPDKASKSTVGTIVLSVEGWGAEDVSQTVQASQVTATNNVVVSLANTATVEEVAECSESCIRATAQGNGTLTFKCMGGTAPAIPIPVIILIVG